MTYGGSAEIYYQDVEQISGLMLHLPTTLSQVNSDWNATSGVEQILNKPTIPAAQVNSDWNATSGVERYLTNLLFLIQVLFL